MDAVWKKGILIGKRVQLSFSNWENIIKKEWATQMETG